jgi:putative membrane protein insertion efficiency factor
MKPFFLFLIKVYQSAISPAFGGRAVCRFVPTCSEYARQAIERYGVWRGSWMALRRIFRCRPGGGFGYDPV